MNAAAPGPPCRRAAGIAAVAGLHGVLAAALWGLAPALGPVPSVGVPPVVARIVQAAPVNLPRQDAAAAASTGSRARPQRVRAPSGMPERPAAGPLADAVERVAVSHGHGVAGPAPAAPAAPATEHPADAAPGTTVAAIEGAAPVRLPAAPRRLAPDHASCARAPHPPLLRERGIEGRVQLRVHVGADGHAREVQLVASSGYRLFDEAALAQARGCRFRPALQDDAPVDAWVEFAVRFALAG